MATWNFDKTHTYAAFTARHMMVTNVRGQFQQVDGVLNYDAGNPNASSVEATIYVKSMASTGVEQRDNHLLSPDFLDAETYPTITFKSTSVSVDGDKGTVTGELTIRDVTRTVTLQVEKMGQLTNPWGQTVAGFTASTKINREDFGLTWNMALEAGGWLVGKEVKIEIEAELVLVTEPTTEAASSN